MSVTAKAVWYIESHLDSELSLESIAEASGVSRFHLSRAFATSTGTSLAGYMRGRRLSEPVSMRRRLSRPRHERHARLIVADVLRRALRGATPSAPAEGRHGQNCENDATDHEPSSLVQQFAA